MDKLNSHKDLIVWNTSVEFVTNIYLTTNNFPKEELYGITSQLKRASISIPSNIAEGVARKGTKEYIHFLHIALGSASEADTLLEICIKIGYINGNSNLLQTITEIRKMLIGLIHSLEQKMSIPNSPLPIP